MNQSASKTAPGTPVKGKAPQGPNAVSIPPDITILVKARVQAGEPSFKIRELGNLLMHDPVLTYEFLQFANSSVFAGQPVVDIEGAINRIGMKRLTSTLASLNVKPNVSMETSEMLELLRYNCRRTSMISLIMCTACRPQLSVTARMSGLFSEIGHMAAASYLGDKYCQLVKTKGRKNVPFRLEKDHKIDVAKLLVTFLQARGIPPKLLLPYGESVSIKAAVDVDLRLTVQGAQELIEAYDSSKFELYESFDSIPARSVLRLLKLSAPQQDKIYRTVAEYLRLVHEQEAPDNAGLLVMSLDEEESIELKDGPGDSIKVPRYPEAPVNPQSREQMQALYEICEAAIDDNNLTRKAVEFLTKSKMFDRAALLRVNGEGSEAVVECAAGFEQKTGDVIPITDPNSPLKVFRMEIKSANVDVKHLSTPFGVAAYALGPVDLAPNGDRVLLYTDNSKARVLPIESRRVFRMATGLLLRSFEALRCRTAGEGAGES